MASQKQLSRLCGRTKSEEFMLAVDTTYYHVY